MKTEIKEISKTVHEMTLTVPAEDATRDHQKIVAQIKKSIMIPGFRKGKAPLSLIEQMYGDYIKEEFYDKKLEDYYKKALEENDINPVSVGKPMKVEWEKGKDLVAVFQYETMPEIKVEKYKNLEIPFEKTVFSEKMIDETLEDYRRQNAEILDADSPIQKGDLLELMFELPAEKGKVAKEFKRFIEAGNNIYSDGFNAALIGKNAGEVIKTTLFDKDKQSTDKEITDDIKDKEFSVKIISVKRMKLSKIDDDFAKDLDFDSLKDLRKKIAEDLKKQIDKQNDDLLRSTIEDKLLEENSIEIPPSFIERVAQKTIEAAKEIKDKNKPEVKTIYNLIAERNLKSHYLIQKIIEKENIEVTEQDKEEIIKEAAKNLNIKIDEYKKLYKNYLESDDFVDSIKIKKAFKIIEDSAKFVPLPEEIKLETDKPKAG